VRRPRETAAKVSASAPKKLGHVPALDGVRGVAILLVLGYHAWGHPSAGFFGVDVFFVLSGFLITTLLLQEIDGTGTINIRQFYARRARRLLPALGAFLVAIGTFLSATPGKAFADIAAGAFYVTNIIRAVGGSQTLPMLGHLWSLAQEEQFYLIWPALLLAAARWTPKRLGGSLALAAAAVALYRIVLLVAGFDHERLYFAPDTHADPIIIGCLLAVALPRVRTIRPWQTLLAAATIAVLSATTVPYSTVSLAIGTPAVSLCAAALIVAALREEGVIARVLRFRPLVWVGTISYSLYLWQQFAHKVVPDATAAAALAIIIAWLSTRYIEQPFRVRRPPAPESSAAAAPATTA
jgi:peptidoglycan/LPS O-acetylase OafA/YrhL